MTPVSRLPVPAEIRKMSGHSCKPLLACRFLYSLLFQAPVFKTLVFRTLASVAYFWAMARQRVLWAATLLGMVAALGGVLQSTAAAMSPEEEFFEAKVRPILVNRCFGCHGSEKQQGEVRLDSRTAMMAANTVGPVLVPGNVDKSRMLQVIHYNEYDTQMPPAGKMPPEEIASLTEWVRRGAIWPGGDRPIATAAKGYDFDALRRDHWAFRPVENPDPPAVKQETLVRTPIDRFILAKLETAGFGLSEPADKRTLVRRVYFDLIGLPPTLAEIERFEADHSPNAYERIVESLLASPEYGVRQGRHWLDVARYADTKGYVVGGEEFRYPFAYTYRDYVIQAFNADKPYDQFILEQLAADKLGLAGNAPELAALGFITVGRQSLNRREEIIDDRIDAVTRGLQGLTVTCARCHDHKFDPIPTADYYSLYGVFDSCDDIPFGECPQIGDVQPTAAFQKFADKVAALEAEKTRYQEELRVKIEKELREQAALYLWAVRKNQILGPKGEILREGAIRAWTALLQRAKPDDLIWGPYVVLKGLTDNDFEAQAELELSKLAENTPFKSGVGRYVLSQLRQTPLRTREELEQRYGALVQSLNTLPPDAGGESRLVAEMLTSSGVPFRVSPEELSKVQNRVERNEVQKKEKQIDTFRASSDQAPPRAMALRDREQPVEPRIFIRGIKGRNGDKVPRQYLRIVAGPDRKPFTSAGSGRLEMARQITDRNNPLTARVYVNRVWQHHFGEAIVPTVSDFGARSDLPSHPELLDWLAADFMNHGWSIKHLHRQIVLSATYRQSSDNRAANTENANTEKANNEKSNNEYASNEKLLTADPLNRLLWRQNRRRLEFEPYRDSLLAAAGQLNQSMYGRPVDMFQATSERQSVYGFIDRNELPGVLRIFDFANPDATTGQRGETTVPQQALFAMNGKFVIQQAQSLASRVAAATPKQDKSPPLAIRNQQIELLYAYALQRTPQQLERQMAARFLEEAPQTAGLAPLAQLAQVLLLTNEFLFVD